MQQSGLDSPRGAHRQGGGEQDGEDSRALQSDTDYGTTLLVDFTTIPPGCLLQEPEAAALWAKSSGATALDPGSTMMILDAGGGTVDWTVHQCILKGGLGAGACGPDDEGGDVEDGAGQQSVLSEAVHAVGEVLGSTLLDRAFMAHLREEVGTKVYDEWTQAHPHEVLLVLGQWESLKCLYGGTRGEYSAGEADNDDDGDNGPRVPIPPSLHSMMSAEDKTRLRVEYGGDDSLTLSYKVMRSLFDPIVNAIIRTTNEQLAKTAVVTGLSSGAHQVLLAGGFCASPYLQEAIRQQVTTASAAPLVITMDKPYAAVLRGAVLYGCNPQLIHARKSRYTYGVRACGPFVDGAPGKFWNQEEQQFYSDSIFSAYVRKGQLIAHDETISHFFIPLYTHQTRCNIEIFLIDSAESSARTSGGKPLKKEAYEFIDTSSADTRKLADLTVHFRPGTGHEDRVISVRLLFGQTEVKASATDESSGSECQTCFKFAVA